MTVVICGKDFEEHVIEVPPGDGRYWSIRAIQLGARYAEWPADEDYPPLPFSLVGIRAIAREQTEEMKSGLPITAKC